MKLHWNLIIVFSTIMIVTVGIFSYITHELVTDTFIEIDLHEMKEKVLQRELQMQNLHDRASEDLVFTLKNPLFVEYFEIKNDQERWKAKFNEITELHQSLVQSRIILK